MIHKMPGEFGQWSTGAENYASDLVWDNDGGVYHCVDVYETEAEWESVRHKGEPAGWTYVADDEGVELLKARYFAIAVFDTYGFTKEEAECMTPTQPS